jgi:hypothetical protein
MKRKIVKYSISDANNGGDVPGLSAIERNGVFKIKMLKYAKILCVQVQSDGLKHPGEDFPEIPPVEQITGKIWAMVWAEETEMEEREFFLMEDGKEFDHKDVEYIGTYQTVFGKIVLHLFEKKKIIHK